jgi:hypothetical protein
MDVDAPRHVCTDRDEDEVSIVLLGDVSFGGCFVAGTLLREVVEDGKL